MSHAGAALTALVAQWREEADEDIKLAELNRATGHHEAANTRNQRAGDLLSRADELEAILKSGEVGAGDARPPVNVDQLWFTAVQRALHDDEEREAHQIFADLLLAADRPAGRPAQEGCP